MVETIALFSTALLFGGMTVFSFGFAPLVFSHFPAETAGGFIRAVFPWYYLFVLAAAVLAGLALAPLSGWAALAMALVAAGAAIARQVLMPAINRARDRQVAGDAAAARRFGLLHGGSVVINFLQLGAVASVLAAFTLRGFA